VKFYGKKTFIKTRSAPTPFLGGSITTCRPKNRKKLARYLKVAVSKPPYAVWSPEDRVADFEAVFGNDWNRFHKKFYKFILSLE
jgi:hypothetical protein